jgi:flagellin
MDEVHQILQRMRELGVQAANDTNDAAARTSIGTELVQLRSEVDRIANATQFNGQSLLTGTLSGQLGGATGADLVVADAVGAAVATGIDVAGAKAGTYTFSSAGAGLLTLTGPSGQAQEISVGAIAALGSATLDFNQLGVKVSLTSTAGDSAANLIGSLTNAVNDTIVVTGSGAAKLQIGANTTANDSLNIAFNDVRATSATGLNMVTAGAVDWTSSSTIVASNTASQALIGQVDAAITTLNTRRSDLGASQNRLEHTVNSLGVSVENLTASESRIRDADIAKLSSEMVSKQILQQAGVSVLSQANQMPQAIASLLRN